jgi:hypothetical protein
VASKRGDQQSEDHAGTGEATYDTAGVNTMAGQELGSSTGSDIEMQDTDLINESEESEGDDADREEMGLTERLVL